jgi:DtxR family Mn-dependent transcriptional regulator
LGGSILRTDASGTYLRIILELEEERIVPLQARIAKRVGHSKPRALAVTNRLVSSGLVTVESKGRLSLTKPGRAHATTVMRKHRLAEALLVDVVGVAFEDAHAEACRWQQVLGVTAERQIFELLGRPTRSPYGNPIPGLAALGGKDSDVDDDQGLVTYAQRLSYGAGSDATVARISEGAQLDGAFLRSLGEAGIGPGKRVRASWAEGTLLVTHQGATVQLNSERAAGIFVVARKSSAITGPNSLALGGGGS